MSGYVPLQSFLPHFLRPKALTLSSAVWMSVSEWVTAISSSFFNALKSEYWLAWLWHELFLLAQQVVKPQVAFLSLTTFLFSLHGPGTGAGRTRLMTAFTDGDLWRANNSRSGEKNIRWTKKKKFVMSPSSALLCCFPTKKIRLHTKLVSRHGRKFSPAKNLLSALLHICEASTRQAFVP